MHRNYEGLDIEALQKLYEAHAAELEKAVLTGNCWDIVSVKRKRLIELSNLLHKKLQCVNQVTAAEQVRSR